MASTLFHVPFSEVSLPLLSYICLPLDSLLWLPPHHHHHHQHWRTQWKHGELKAVQPYSYRLGVPQTLGINTQRCVYI